MSFSKKTIFFRGKTQNNVQNPRPTGEKVVSLPLVCPFKTTFWIDRGGERPFFDFSKKTPFFYPLRFWTGFGGFFPGGGHFAPFLHEKRQTVP
jgi:hypothetical protein